MATFTTRIVLHNAEWNDYNELYEAMEREGFTDEITSGDGVTYKMPDGEYDISGSFSSSDVLAKAKKAAATTGKKYAVFVTQSSGRTWYNLEKV